MAQFPQALHPSQRWHSAQKLYCVPVGGVADDLQYYRAMAKRETPTIRLRIDLTPESALGPGKISLLEHIESTGSLSQAARELGMSYRRAWLLLDDINGMFSEPATTASVGGSGGGGARLTDLGREIVKA